MDYHVSQYLHNKGQDTSSCQYLRQARIGYDIHTPQIVRYRIRHPVNILDRLEKDTTFCQFLRQAGYVILSTHQTG